MPVVINSNASATTASFNLSRANDALRKSLARLSSGKRITSPADDAGGLSVAYKLNSKAQRTEGVMQNVQNALSYMQMQDSALQGIGKILDRMAELRTMANDVTKSSSDIENYSKEFVELQSQLKQIKNESFNGISLFSAGAYDASNDPTLGRTDNGLTIAASGGSAAENFHKYGRTLYTHPGGQTNDGSISLNVVNLEYVLHVGKMDENNKSYWGGAAAATSVDLGNVGDTANTGGGIGTDGFISTILAVSIGQLTAAIERLADVRAENGSEQNRALAAYDLLSSNLVNLEAAHGRIMDADVALESTRFARHNILVQASASMTAQANQLSNVALSLIG